MLQLYNSHSAIILALKLSPPDNYNPVICLFLKIEFGINFFSGLFDLSIDEQISTAILEILGNFYWSICYGVVFL